jgi:hypothetical protein
MNRRGNLRWLKRKAKRKRKRAEESPLTIKSPKRGLRDCFLIVKDVDPATSWLTMGTATLVDIAV